MAFWVGLSSWNGPYVGVEAPTALPWCAKATVSPDINTSSTTYGCHVPSGASMPDEPGGIRMA